MSFGLSIIGNSGREVLNSSVLPYRFTLVNVPFDRVQIGTGSLIYLQKDVHDTVTPYAMASITGVNGWSTKFVLYGGRWHVRLSVYLRDYVRNNYTGDPRLYLMDRVTPSAPAGGYGIEVYGADSARLLNSSTPLVQVVSTGSGETVSGRYGQPIIPVSVGTSPGHLFVLENVSGEHDSGYQNTYPGGSTYTEEGWYMDVSDNGTNFLVSAAEWYEEMGENANVRGRKIPFRYSLVKKPVI